MHLQIMHWLCYSPGHSVTGWVFWDIDQDREGQVGLLLEMALGTNIYRREEKGVEFIRADPRASFGAEMAQELS